jgi:hypothetical protein
MAEERSFNLNRPEATARDEYLYLWQTYEINLAHLICNSDIKFDPRIPRMVRFMISLMAHDGIRYTAEETFDNAIAYANGRKDLSLDERNEMILRISATMCGNLTSYVDQFKGLSHQLKIGELVDITKQYFKDAYKTDEPELSPEDEDAMVLTKSNLILIQGGQLISPYQTIEEDAEDEIETVNNDGESHATTTDE